MSSLMIFTNKRDPHADHLIKYLKKSRDLAVLRVNTEDFLRRYKFGFSVRKNRHEAFIRDEYGRSFSLLENRIAWFRKPDFSFDLSGFGFSAEDAMFIRDELKMVIETMYGLPETKWVNDPNEARRARQKFQQLIMAENLGRKTGVLVPDTVMTNSSDVARNFFSKRQYLAVKSVYAGNVTINGRNQGVETHKISFHDFLENIGAIDISPTCLQSYVEKKFELRVVVIGERVFAVKIDSQLNENTKVDWRKHARLCPHTIFSLPIEIESFCKDFIREQKLVYGSLDFIVTPKDEFYFLENNPFGQWLWLEQMTGIPLTEAFADYFLGSRN